MEAIRDPKDLFRHSVGTRAKTTPDTAMSTSMDHTSSESEREENEDAHDLDDSTPRHPSKHRIGTSSGSEDGEDDVEGLRSR